MARRCGRPAKGAELTDSRQIIIDTAVRIIREQGAGCVTVRHICESSGLSIGTFYHYFRDKDDLMMYFVRVIDFDALALQADADRVGDRQCELYMHLIKQYVQLGDDFMKKFYTTDNCSLSAYMGEQNGNYSAGTVMARSERELRGAQQAGRLYKEADVHLLAMDICTIVKGCVFEWCLNGGAFSIEDSLRRIINNYLTPYLQDRPKHIGQA